MLRRLLRDRLLLVLAIAAGLAMYGSAVAGLTGVDRRLELAAAEQKSTPAPEWPPAIHGTTIRFEKRGCSGREPRRRERRLRRLDRTL